MIGTGRANDHIRVVAVDTELRGLGTARVAMIPSATTIVAIVIIIAITIVMAIAMTIAIVVVVTVAVTVTVADRGERRGPGLRADAPVDREMPRLLEPPNRGRGLRPVSAVDSDRAPEPDQPVLKHLHVGACGGDQDRGQDEPRPAPDGSAGHGPDGPRPVPDGSIAVAWVRSSDGCPDPERPGHKCAG